MQEKEIIMKSSNQLHQELRERILSLPGVTERQHAGIHEDAFFVGSTMDDRSASASHSGGLFDLSKSGGRCAQDGSHCFSQSRRGIHARRNRAKNTSPQNRRHREITNGRGRADVAIASCALTQPS
jgi:hypothetical protein